MDVVDSEFFTLWNGSFSEQVKKNGHRYQSTSEPGNFEPPIIQWAVDLMNVGMVEAQPKVCDGNLIAATSGGIIAIDFKTGKKLWSKELANVGEVARRGVTCAIIDTDKERRILVPTFSGILCLKAKTGKVDRAICDKGRLGHFISKIPPEVDGRRVFVATMNPSGVEAYDIATGERLWRTEFEEGSSLLEGGSNPWSGFIIDRERGLLFVNTGSPSSWNRFIFGPDKYLPPKGY
jgi:outer membrane protein assembly factor BamB